MKRGYVIVGTAAIALALAACGGEDKNAETFDTTKLVSGTAEKGRPNGYCDFHDESLRAGDPVILKGADGTILGKSNLVVDKLYVDQASGVPDICSYKFTLKGVKANESGYEVKVGDYAPVVATEEELRNNSFYFSPRTTMDATAYGKTEPLVIVDERK